MQNEREKFKKNSFYLLSGRQFSMINDQFSMNFQWLNFQTKTKIMI